MPEMSERLSLYASVRFLMPSMAQEKATASHSEAAAAVIALFRYALLCRAGRCAGRAVALIGAVVSVALLRRYAYIDLFRQIRFSFILSYFVFSVKSKKG